MSESHCGTSETPSWRRSADGEPVCNACGIYHRTNKRKRPVAIKDDSSNMNQTQYRSVKKRITVDMLVNTAKSGSEGNDEAEPQPTHKPMDDRDRTTREQCSGWPTDSLSSSVDGQDDPTHAEAPKTPICWNCSTTSASLWRRDSSGNTVCNACGTYNNQHGPNLSQNPDRSSRALSQVSRKSKTDPDEKHRNQTPQPLRRVGILL